MTKALRLFLLFLAALTLAVAQAERLPIKTYTIADGLPRDHINSILQDDKGYLWFSTSEGLSRFDGYKFTNYGEQQGLKNRRVNAFLQRSDGTYWAATDSGLYKLDPNASGGQPRFIPFFPPEQESNDVEALFEDHNHVMWCGTTGGLYRFDYDQSGTAKFTRMTFIKPAQLDDLKVRSITEDKQGNLWIAASYGLYVRHANGEVDEFKGNKELPAQFALFSTRDGTVYACTSIGLVQLSKNPGQGNPIIDHVYTTREGLPFIGVFTGFQSADGNIWIGTSSGIGLLSPHAGLGSQTIKSITLANGLSDTSITCINQDRDGNVWIGTDAGGAMRIASVGFSSYGESDGIANPGVTALFLDQPGRFCALTKSSSINTFDGSRFAAASLTLPKGFSWDWGWNQLTFQDREGEWWMATAKGLVRYSKMSASQLATAKPKAIYTTADGLPSNEIFRLFEDSHRDIWISTLGSLQGIVLTRWDRATGKFHFFSPNIVDTRAAPTAFVEDASKTLWMGLYSGGLIKYSQGRFTRLTTADGIPDGLIEAIYLDHSNRLWIATDQTGIARLENLDNPTPKITKYTTADGLSSNQANCITEDRWGNIYIGTGRGVDQLDPTTGHIKHFSTADGLATSNVYVALRDRDGSLWFGTQHGLSRLIPQQDLPAAPPPIVINALSISGVSHPVSELGEKTVALSNLGPNQNDIEIEYAGLSLAVGDSLSYEYKLEGASNQWSAPSSQRSVNYPSLSPGTYKFFVRAVSSSGVQSDSPASVSFNILPPIWQRWWFIAGVVLLVALIVYMADRYRVARLLELERVRTRIATDLHDDIGASLSRMAILSEVVKQQTGQADLKSAGMLTEIADSARGLVDSMSDIVWSIDPSKDNLTNVVMRTRAFASDVLEPRGIHWELIAPTDIDKIKLSPDQRRHIYLIFKEAINNAARHSACKNAKLNLSIVDGWLTADVIDDGQGLPVKDVSDKLGGNGLKNMRLRATELGGKLDVSTPPEGGTHLKFTAHLK